MDKTDKIFKEETAGTAHVSMKISHELKNELNKVVKLIGISRSSVIRSFIRYGLKSVNQSEK